jgi:hypothetical protein
MSNQQDKLSTAEGLIMSAFSRRTFIGTAVAAAGSFAGLQKAAGAVAKPGGEPDFA